MAAKSGFPTLDGVSTLYDLFERSVAKFPDSKCLGWRPIKDGKAQDYVYITYKQVQGTGLWNPCSRCGANRRDPGLCGTFPVLPGTILLERHIFERRFTSEGIQVVWQGGSLPVQLDSCAGEGGSVDGGSTEFDEPLQVALQHFGPKRRVLLCRKGRDSGFRTGERGSQRRCALPSLPPPICLQYAVK